MDTAEKQRYDVGPSEVVPDAGRLVVDAGGTVVGVFRVDGRLYAYQNTCAHQGGPVCQGKLLPRIAEQLAGDLTERGHAVRSQRSAHRLPLARLRVLDHDRSPRRRRHDQPGRRPVTEENGRVYLDV